MFDLIGRIVVGLYLAAVVVKVIDAVENKVKASEEVEEIKEVTE